MLASAIDCAEEKKWDAATEFYCDFAGLLYEEIEQDVIQRPMAVLKRTSPPTAEPSPPRQKKKVPEYDIIMGTIKRNPRVMLSFYLSRGVKDMDGTRQALLKGIQSLQDSKIVAALNQALAKPASLVTVVRCKAFDQYVEKLVHAVTVVGECDAFASLFGAARQGVYQVPDHCFFFILGPKMKQRPAREAAGGGPYVVAPVEDPSGMWRYIGFNPELVPDCALWETGGVPSALELQARFMFYVLFCMDCVYKKLAW
jgi:hypothetical protein